jgi:replication factor C small subunit
MSVELWTEKYRPKSFNDYVWRDSTMKQKAQQWLTERALPHVVLSGRAGTGKTSLAKMMLRELGIPQGDILSINASHERKIDELEDRILGFVKTYPMFDNPTHIKYVLLDEADSLSPLSQRFLRAEMETYSKTTRFILTCNHREKISQPILSRCQMYHFEALSQEEFINRIVEILETEGVKWEIDDLQAYIEAAYPDLRKCINVVQQGTVGGVLKPHKAEDAGDVEYMLVVTDLFKKKRFLEARKLIVDQASVDEYPELFRWMYQNLALWGSTEPAQDDALIIIRDGIYKHNFVADPELNISATLAELARIERT